MFSGMISEFTKMKSNRLQKSHKMFYLFQHSNIENSVCVIFILIPVISAKIIHEKIPRRNKITHILFLQTFPRKQPSSLFDGVLSCSKYVIEINDVNLLTIRLNLLLNCKRNKRVDFPVLSF